jgi:hypothetical protein
MRSHWEEWLMTGSMLSASSLHWGGWQFTGQREKESANA